MSTRSAITAWLAVLALHIAPAQAAEDLRLVVQADPNALDYNQATAVSSDGKYVLSVGADSGIMVIWNFDSGTIIDTVTLPGGDPAGANIDSVTMADDDATITVDRMVNGPKQCHRYVFSLIDHAWQSVVPGLTPCAVPVQAAGVTVGLQHGMGSIYNGFQEITTTKAMFDADGHLLKALDRQISDRVDTAALSPDARYFAYVNTGDNTGQTVTVSVMDLANSTFRDPIVVQASAGKYHARLQWAGAGRLTLGWTYPGNLGRPTTAAPADQVIDLGDGTTGDTVVAGKQGGGHVPDSLVFTNATTTLSVSGTTVARTDLATHTPQSPLIAQGTAVAGGFSDDGRLFWLASECNGIRFWRTADWSLAMTLYLIKGQHYFVFAPSGRYDTNHAPDTDEFRWLVRDAPLQSLGPQTFMRDYFKPRLAALALDGSEANDPIPSIRSLNRVLPQVLFTGVDPGPTPDTALVHLGVLQGVDASAANGKTRSGIYNLRLFRDNALIAQWPATAPAENTDLATWQQANALTPDAQGYVNVTYLAHLPTGARTARTTFSAYAFNSDRVKSDTVRQVYRRPAIAPRPPRAYVLTIGINRYAQSRLQLHFAVNDAQLLARRLAQLPGYDVRQVTLASEQADRPVTKAAIAAALDLLAGGDRTTDLAKLAAAGADGDAFAQATPDDLVMITFSGHGWADPHSNFYLLPADAQWPDSAPTPDTGTLVSSAEIATWLRNIDAGAMALVIDACHSAASVATSGFRPGPMGDSGLGQLAYDKGIRLLAASQADDVAMEDAALQQGLLTYALADEGLNASGFGLADLNHDGRIMLDEWLRYALHRLPSLSTDAQAHRFGNGMGAKSAFTVISDSQALPARSQDPALFDFNVHPSTDALRIRTP